MATTYDKASLVMIPSGIKESKLYSIKPTDGSGDFTFSRGTDTATRVNASGLIEKERSNQILQSNSFDTTWVNFNTTETSGQSGYDGSSDAWLLENTAANGSIRQTISASGVQTYSFYAKAGTTDWVAAYVATSGSIPYCFFDLTNGVKGATQNNVIDSSITDVGGGWYRIALAFNTTITDVRIFPAEANAVLASQVGDNIYIQDAMLNQGLVAQPYIETTTAAVYEGITDNLPRLDYSGGASCPSLLLEPSRTNIVAQSEYFDGWAQTSAGTGSNPVLTTNDAISPEGVQNATKMVFDVGAGTTSGDISELFISVSGLTSGASYVSSVYLKGENGGEEILVRSVQGAYTKYTLTTEWERYEFLETAAGTSYSASITLRQNVGHGILNSTATIYAYGFQVELGSYPTSYIPTYGTSASRAVDECSKTGISSLIGQTEGSAFIEFDPRNGTGERRFFLQLGTGSTTIYARIESGGTLTAQILNGGTDYLTSTGTAVSSGTNKFAVAYANNDAVFYLNGTQLATSSSVVVPALSALYIGSNSSLSQQVGGDVGQTLLFKTRLTNAELAALTTI